MFVMIINALIDVLVSIFGFLFSMLPDTPFQFSPLDWGVFGQVIGLIFPIGDMATHFVLILSAFATYYSVRWLLRLIRQIQ